MPDPDKLSHSSWWDQVPTPANPFPEWLKRFNPLLERANTNPIYFRYKAENGAKRLEASFMILGIMMGTFVLGFLEGFFQGFHWVLYGLGAVAVIWLFSCFFRAKVAKPFPLLDVVKRKTYMPQRVVQLKEMGVDGQTLCEAQYLARCENVVPLFWTFLLMGLIAAAMGGLGLGISLSVLLFAPLMMTMAAVGFFLMAVVYHRSMLVKLLVPAFGSAKMRLSRSWCAVACSVAMPVLVLLLLGLTVWIMVAGQKVASAADLSFFFLLCALHLVASLLLLLTVGVSWREQARAPEAIFDQADSTFERLVASARTSDYFQRRTFGPPPSVPREVLL